MRLLLTGGGTGGHVYPALAVAEAMRDAGSGAPGVEARAPEILFVGSRGGMEAELVSGAGLRFRGIAAGPLRGRNPAGVAEGLVQLAVGLSEAFSICRTYRPHAALATGGYVCVPVVLACWLMRVPSVLYLPDVRPGLAIRSLSRFASAVAVTTLESASFLPGARVVETGYPVRSELGRESRTEARRRLGLDPSRRALLVVGGSRGARTLNEATYDGLPSLLAEWQVLHVTGKASSLEAERRRARLGGALAEDYHPRGYLHGNDLAAALSAADLVVSRAGASVMGEYPAAGLPSILVPYPYAGGHQRLNADLLARYGAAVVVENGAARDGALVAKIHELGAEPERLTVMARAARRLARPEAARRIAEVVRDTSRTRWGNDDG